MDKKFFITSFNGGSKFICDFNKRTGYTGNLVGAYAPNTFHFLKKCLGRFPDSQEDIAIEMAMVSYQQLKNAYGGTEVFGIGVFCGDLTDDKPPVQVVVAGQDRFKTSLFKGEYIPKSGISHHAYVQEFEEYVQSLIEDLVISFEKDNVNFGQVYSAPEFTRKLISGKASYESNITVDDSRPLVIASGDFLGNDYSSLIEAKNRLEQSGKAVIFETALRTSEHFHKSFKEIQKFQKFVDDNNFNYLYTNAPLFIDKVHYFGKFKPSFLMGADTFSEMLSQKHYSGSIKALESFIKHSKNLGIHYYVIDKDGKTASNVIENKMLFGWLDGFYTEIKI